MLFTITMQCTVLRLGDLKQLIVQLLIVALQSRWAKLLFSTFGLGWRTSLSSQGSYSCLGAVGQDGFALMTN